MESMRLTVGLLKPKTVMISFVAHRALICTQFETGSSSGLRARCGVGAARCAGVSAKMVFNCAKLCDVRTSKVAAVRIT